MRKEIIDITSLEAHQKLEMRMLFMNYTFINAFAEPIRKVVKAFHEVLRNPDFIKLLKEDEDSKKKNN